MSVYPEAIELEAYLGSSWVSLLPDFIGSISGRDGFSRGGFMERVASQGTLETELNNEQGKYVAGGSNALAGWRGSIPIRFNVVFDGESINIFTGRLDTSTGKVKPPAWLNIKANDWLRATSQEDIRNQGILTNRTIDDAVRVLLSKMQWIPRNLEIEAGINLFPTVFDNIGLRGSPASELAKLANSELGYVYMRRDDTLVVESMASRQSRIIPSFISEAYEIPDAFSDTMLLEDGDDAVYEDDDDILLNEVQAAQFSNSADFIPVASEFCDEILFEDGDEALFEDGVVMLFNDVEEAVFDDDFMDLEMEAAPDYFNLADITSYPRKTDEDPIRLYTLGEPIALPANTPYVLKGNWTNASGQAIGAANADTPAQDTNYTANSKKNGSGTNLTSQLVVQEWIPSANGFEAHLVSPAGGWLRKWDIEGLGIYAYDRAETELRDEEVIAQDGDKSLAIDQTYLGGLGFSRGRVAAEMVLRRGRELDAVRAHMIANKSSKYMQAFRYLQTGNVVRIKNAKYDIDRFYTIRSREYSLDPGRSIPFSWGLRRAFSQADLTEVEMEFAISSSTVQEAIAFGVLPSWAHRKLTFFCEVYVTSVASAATLMSLPYLAGGENAHLRLQVSSAGVLLARTAQFATAGTWTSTGDSVGTGAWVPVAMTYDSEALSNVPKFYIGGELQSVTGATQPTGARVDESITFLEIGGHMAAQSSTSYSVRIRRPRLFGDVLTGDEVLMLARAPQDMSLFADRLLIGGMGVPNSAYSEWLDDAVGGDVRVLDFVAAEATTEVSGTPMIRAIS